MKTLVIAEHDNFNLKPATFAALAAAQQFKNPINVLVVGYHCQSIAEQVSGFKGVEVVYLAEHEVYQHPVAEQLSQVILSLAAEFNHILVSASSFGKDLMPRVAALLNVAQISEVVKIIDADTFIRPIYAGNALATVKSLDPIKILTIRATAFQQAQVVTVNPALIKPYHGIVEATTCRWLGQQLTQSVRPELSNARVVIAGGRGLGSAANFKLLERLADLLNAAIGASRAAVDAAYVPNDYQIGQTGKVVAPELYIAVGISGAIQHVAGMKESKVIVAINKDPDAPIFTIADYGLVGDLFAIIPEWCELLASRIK